MKKQPGYPQNEKNSEEEQFFYREIAQKSRFSRKKEKPLFLGLQRKAAKMHFFAERASSNFREIM